MPLRPEYALVHSEFNEFLFAFVGEEKSGLPLTLLSALARLELDPWEEAARLRTLSREAATGALAAAIGKLPEGKWKTADARSIATRLLEKLPSHRAAPIAARGNGGGDRSAQGFLARNWLLWAGLGAAVFVVVLRLFGN